MLIYGEEFDTFDVYNESYPIGMQNEKLPMIYGYMKPFHDMLSELYHYDDYYMIAYNNVIEQLESTLRNKNICLLRRSKNFVVFLTQFVH